MNTVNSPGTIPALTIVIPCYNHGRFIKELLESISAQTLKNIETIIVNDGSTDCTENIVRNFIATNSGLNLKLINQDNGGTSVARNRGIAASSAEFILTVDADDIIYPKFAEKMLQTISRHKNTGIAYSDFFDTALNEPVRRSPSVSNVDKGLQSPGGNIIFRKRAWLDAGGFDPNMTVGYEDWDFAVKVLEKGWKIVHLPEVLFSYRKHGISRSTKAEEIGPYLRSGIFLKHPKLYSEETLALAEKIVAHYNFTKNMGSRTEGPLISIVVISTNSDENLTSVKKSLQSQVYRDFEIIMPADNKPNNATFGAIFKSALSRAKGKYITFFEKESCLYPEHLSVLVEYMETTGYSESYSEGFLIHNSLKNPFFPENRWLEYIISLQKIPLSPFVLKSSTASKYKNIEDSAGSWEFLVQLSVSGALKSTGRFTFELKPSAPVEVAFNFKNSLSHIIKEQSVIINTTKKLELTKRERKAVAFKLSSVYSKFLPSHQASLNIVSELIKNSGLAGKLILSLRGKYFPAKTRGILRAFKDYFFKKSSEHKK